MAKHKLPQWLLPLAYMLAFGIVWYSFQHFPNNEQPKQVPYSDFLLEIRSGHLSEVAIDEQLFVATLQPSAARKRPAPQLAAVAIPWLHKSSLPGGIRAQHVTFSGNV